MVSYAVAAVIALVAALLGGLAGMLYQDWRRPKSRRRSRSSEATEEAWPDPAAPTRAGRDAQLTRENQQLREERDRLRLAKAELAREVTELQYLLRGEKPGQNKPRPAAPARKYGFPIASTTAPPAPADPAPAPPAPAAPATAAPAAVAPAADPPLVPAAASASAASSTLLYASAAPGGFLEAERLSAQPMHRMQLEIHPDAQHPDRASFTLSPGVDVSWLIEAGLDRLRDYFDYTPPAGKPVTVAAAAAGQLLRQGAGWQVSEKAQLDVQ